ncbi:hypothetical protein QVD17_19618 [Tagetes erecta]|uniref:Uncharacterized protein n=1 Tax=Tagetes erecta TaxID=13708 RepID=A0AAD8NX28_TARER|nr:hypothetical protein QVD17_19618 [Tagetes erecta]
MIGDDDGLVVAGDGGGSGSGDGSDGGYGEDGGGDEDDDNIVTSGAHSVHNLDVNFCDFVAMAVIEQFPSRASSFNIREDSFC